MRITLLGFLFCFLYTSVQSQVYITEIMYNTPSTDDEWIEVCNANATAEDISGWTITYSTGTFTFPAATSLPAGACFVVATGDDGQSDPYNDCSTGSTPSDCGGVFTPDFVATGVTIGGTSSTNSLGNTSGTITLADAGAVAQHTIMYDDGDGGDGNGQTQTFTSANCSTFCGTGALGTPGTFTAPATNTSVQFVSTTSTVTEDVVSTTVCVEITNEDAVVATTVEVALNVGSSATDGTDFTAAPTLTATLTFPAGDATAQCVTFTITDDVDVEGDEDIILDLQNPAGGNSAALGTNVLHTLTITDNDNNCPNPGDLVISEILYNPSGSLEGDSEWFEVCNTTAAAIDMIDMEIGDNGASNHIVAFNVIVPAGGCVVIASGLVGCGAAFPPAYMYGNDFTLNNTTDDVEIICAGTVIDMVSYGGAGFPSEANGESIQLNPSTLNATDNDSGANWCISTTACGLGDTGTPGAMNPACPACDLTISVQPAECITNTSGVDSYTFEVDFSGGNNGDTYTIDPSVAGIAVSGDDPNVSTGGTIVYTVTEGIDPNFSITSTDGCDLPVAVTSPVCDCTGAAGPCENTGSITITEIMYDPCSGGSGFWPSEGDGEYVEICNCGATTVDISKWQLRDEASRGDGIASSYYTFPDMTALAAGECAVVANTPVFTALSPASGYQLFDRMKASAELDNSGATPTNEAGLYLIAFDGSLIDEVIWDDPNGASPAFPSCAGTNDGISLVLMDCSLDNSLGSSWYPSFNGGDLLAGGGTPGTANTAAACIDNVTVSSAAVCNGDNAEFQISFDYSYAYLNPDITFDLVQTDIAETVIMTSAAQMSASGIGITMDVVITGPTAATTVTYEVRVSGAAANACFTPEVSVSIPTCSTAATSCGVMITEIMYNPASPEPAAEWIEVANTTAAAIDMTGWTLSDEDGSIALPAGLMIPAGGIFVFGGATLADFDAAWGPGFTASNYLQVDYNNLNGLGNSPSATGEIIQLMDATPALVDEVNYDDSGDWPSDNGNASIYVDVCDNVCGTSIANLLCNVDNNVGTNWSRSVEGVDFAVTDLASTGTFSGDDNASPGDICGVQDVLACLVDPLPVELVYFKGNKIGKKSELMWETASEENNHYFVVEHSSNGLDFLDLGRVEGAGTTAEVNQYDFIHANPLMSTNYYRLRIVAFDGSVEYSNIISLSFNELNSNLISVRPTVSNDKITLSSSILFETNARIQIVNVSGQIVSTLEWEQGNPEKSINIKEFSAGHYFVQVISNNKIMTTRFIKQD